MYHPTYGWLPGNVPPQAFSYGFVVAAPSPPPFLMQQGQARMPVSYLPVQSSLGGMPGISSFPQYGNSYNQSEGAPLLPISAVYWPNGEAASHTAEQPVSKSSHKRPQNAEIEPRQAKNGSLDPKVLRENLNHWTACGYLYAWLQLFSEIDCDQPSSRDMIIKDLNLLLPFLGKEGEVPFFKKFSRSLCRKIENGGLVVGCNKREEIIINDEVISSIADSAKKLATQLAKSDSEEYRRIQSIIIENIGNKELSGEALLLLLADSVKEILQKISSEEVENIDLPDGCVDGEKSPNKSGISPQSASLAQEPVLGKLDNAKAKALAGQATQKTC